MKCLSNKYLNYAGSRYITYFVFFINSLLIADRLGPFYFGIWGFINLIIQYFNQFNLGIPQALTTITSIYKKSDRYVKLTFSTTLCMITLLAIFTIFVFIVIYLFNLGSEYSFRDYTVKVGLIAILNYYIQLFSNLFRVFGKLWEIALCQSLVPVLTLACVLFIKGEQLIDALVGIQVIALLISLLIFLINSPIKLNLTFIPQLICKIQKRAKYLFLYNVSFYLIMILTRLVISIYFTVEVFGLFSFAFMLANSVLLLLESFSFLILPKSINKLSKSSGEESILVVRKIQIIYTTLAHGLIHIAIFIVPFIFIFFPKYDASINLFRLIALTLVLYANSFGCSNLLMAKSKEKLLGITAFSILILNTFSVFLIAKFIGNIYMVLISTTISYFLYTSLLNLISLRISNISVAKGRSLLPAFPFALLFPFLISIFLLGIRANNMYFFIPLGVYLGFNYKTIKQVIVFILTFLKEKNKLDI